MLSLLLPFGAALLLVYVLTPLVIRGAHRAGILDVPTDDRRAHSVPVPRLGGVAVFLAIWLTWIGHSFTAGSPWNPFGSEQQNLTLGIAIGSGFIFLVGVLDDVRGVSPRLKLVFQVCAALTVVAYGLTPDTIALVPSTEPWHAGQLLGTGVLILWIVGVTNAFNLIDGLDGLAGSFALIAVAVVMASIAFIHPGLPISTPAILAGATLGFMRFNWHPARVFLGDAGSMTLGFLLAVLTVVSATDTDGVTYPLIPLLALAFPITDTLVAIVRRWVRGVSFSLADGRHIHHQLRAAGLSVPEAVRVLVMLFAFIAALGLTVIFAPPRFVTGVILGGVPALIAATVYGVRWLQYDEFVEFGSSIATTVRQARQVVRIKIHTNEAAAGILSANSVAEIKEILDTLADAVGLLDIELLEAGQKDTVSPPSRQIAKIDAQPLRLDYTIIWPGSAMNHRATVRLWRAIDEERQVHAMEWVATRIGPAVGTWLASHATVPVHDAGATGASVHSGTLPS